MHVSITFLQIQNYLCHFFILVVESYCYFISNELSHLEFLKIEMFILTKGIKPMKVVVKVVVVKVVVVVVTLVVVVVNKNPRFLLKFLF